MRLCVAGGTGQTGREVVAQALRQGHQVCVISRHPPSGSSEQHRSGQDCSVRLDGVAYFTGDVMLSIINFDQSSSAFYRSKAAKEAVYAAPDRRAGEQTFEAWLTARLAKREEYL